MKMFGMNKIITVSSLRLDTVISAYLSIYQGKNHKLLINTGLVKVNWTVIENPSFECGEGDTISVRGYGEQNIFN